MSEPRMTVVPAFSHSICNYMYILLWLSFPIFMSYLSFSQETRQRLGSVWCVHMFLLFFQWCWGFRLASFPMRLRAFTGRVLFFLFDEITWITDLTFFICWLWYVCPFGLSTGMNSVTWNVQTLPLLVVYSALCSSLSQCDGNRLMVLDNVATAQWQMKEWKRSLSLCLAQQYYVWQKRSKCCF